MGVSKTIYLGPYLRCETRVEEIVTAVRGCPGPDCSEYNKWAPTEAKYCSRCGDRIVPLNRGTRIAAPDPDPTVLFDGSEPMMPVHRLSNGAFAGPAGAHYWVTNRRDCPPRRFHLNNGDHLVEVTGEVRKAEMLAFSKFHEADIAKLEAAYGKDNVRLEWGLIVYTS